MLYQSFGAGAAEVEVDCVTGERTLLRADLMFDAGRSVSPAIDMGQVRGAHCKLCFLLVCVSYPTPMACLGVGGAGGGGGWGLLLLSADPPV